MWSIKPDISFNRHCRTVPSQPYSLARGEGDIKSGARRSFAGHCVCFCFFGIGSCFRPSRKCDCSAFSSRVCRVPPFWGFEGGDKGQRKVFGDGSSSVSFLSVVCAPFLSFLVCFFAFPVVREGVRGVYVPSSFQAGRLGHFPICQFLSSA